MSSDRHESFMRKNASLSMAWEMDKKDKQKGKSDTKGKEKQAVCSECKQDKMCRSVRTATSKRAEGVASFAYEYIPVCQDCLDAREEKNRKKSGEKSQQQIKSMLRGLKKGRF